MHLLHLLEAPKCTIASLSDLSLVCKFAADELLNANLTYDFPTQESFVDNPRMDLFVHLFALY